MQAAVAAFAAVLLVPAAASALTVTKAEFRDGQLRVEGTDPFQLAQVTAKSSFSTATARADSQGRFKIEASNFTADDCTVIVSDGLTPIAIPALSGCTPVAPTPVGENPPPTGSCVIDAPQPATFDVGDQSSMAITTTGCDTSLGQVEWAVVAGSLPPGMSAPTAQGAATGEIAGTPVKEGTYQFTVRATDSAGASDQKTFTVTIAPPRPLTPCCVSTVLSGSVGQFFLVSPQADGGLPGYSWSVVGGTLPPGVTLVDESVLRGSPTQAGTFTFTLRVTDSRGATADEDMTVTVAP